jgi:integrase/recombinase XerD
MGAVVRIKSQSSLATDFSAAIDAFLNYAESKNLSKKTLDYYHFSLLPFTRFLNAHYQGITPEEITPAVIREAVTWQREQSSPATANHCLALIKRLYNFLVNEGYIAESPAAKVEKLRTTRKVIETFSSEQIEKVLNACEGREFVDVRDKAILLMLLDTGLRASELCGIALQDVDLDAQTIHIRHGKGDKERTVPFGRGVKQALSQYLRMREGIESSHLFITRDCNPLDRYRLKDLVRRRCKRAGITGIRPSPHTLRHTAAVFYLRAGGDTFTLQKLLGHSSQEMTRRYCESLSAEDVQQKHREYSPVDNMKLRDPKSGRKRLR